MNRMPPTDTEQEARRTMLRNLTGAALLITGLALATWLMVTVGR